MTVLHGRWRCQGVANWPGGERLRAGPLSWGGGAVAVYTGSRCTAEVRILFIAQLFKWAGAYAKSLIPAEG